MVDTLSIKRTGSAHFDSLTIILGLAFDRALCLESEVSAECLTLPGMSGKRYRMFINNLIRLVSKPRYLEIGSWAGSTACAVMDKNIVKVTCIDNWSQFGGPREAFLNNTGDFITKDIDFSFIESDFRAVDVSKIGNFNVYLFDGPHEQQDQYDGLFMYDAALDDDLLFIVDDWNWKQVRDGTFNAIRETGFRIDYAIELRTTLDNEHAAVAGEASDWHNGYFLSKLSRVKRRHSAH
jgi:hypothetical protein